MTDARAYKIYTPTQWAERSADGPLPWAPVDLDDGFMHLSTAGQILETANKHFGGQTSVVLLEVHLHRLPQGRLRWEPSRGGALFPHVYGELPKTAVGRHWVLAGPAGAFELPEDLSRED